MSGGLSPSLGFAYALNTVSGFSPSLFLLNQMETPVCETDFIDGRERSRSSEAWVALHRLDSLLFYSAIL